MALQALPGSRRVTALLAVVLLVLVGLTSCSLEVKGVTGLTVDADGRVLAALAWCAERPPDVVVLSATDESVSPTHSGAADETPNAPVAWPRWMYDVPPDVTSPVTVPLVDFPPEAAAPDTAFGMYGGGPNNTFTSLSVHFQIAELTDLVPGSILVTTYANGAKIVHESLSLDEFADRGNSQC